MAILTDAPQGAKVLDLDAARAARAEVRAAAGEAAKYIKTSLGYVGVKPEVDITAGEDFMAGNLRSGVAKLLADPADVDQVLAAGLSKQDLDAIHEFITGGVSLGEPAASSAS